MQSVDGIQEVKIPKLATTFFTPVGHEADWIFLGKTPLIGSSSRAQNAMMYYIM